MMVWLKRKSASVLSFTAFPACSCGSVWSVVVEWRERRVVWRKVVEGKRRKEWKTKNTNPIATL